MNKIGPYANVHETYPFYQLPLCRPKTVNKQVLLFASFFFQILLIDCNLVFNINFFSLLIMLV